MSRVKVFIFCLLAFAFFSSACKSDYNPSAKQDPSSKAASAPKQVKTALVTEMPLTKAVTVTGTLAAYDQATLSVKVPGRIQTIPIDLGSVVKKGQLVA